MNKKKLIRPLLAILVVAAVAGWWLLRTGQPADTSRLTLYGNVDIREVDLSFNNSEHVDRILVQEGDRVEKDQLLASLHNSRLQAELAAAEAQVAAQQAVLARLEAGSRPEEVRQARANVARAEAQLTDARASYERIQDLHRKKLASQQNLDDAKAALDQAEAGLKVTREALKLAQEGPRSEDIDQARAQLRAAQAQQALAEERFKDADLYAPAAGVVRNRILEPGDMATPLTPVLTLAKTDPVWVRAYAGETVLGRLVPGMRAEIRTDSYPGKVYQGWLGYMSPTAEFTPKTVETPELRTRLVYQVRIYACNPDDELRLGMPATVSIDLTQDRRDLTAPACADGAATGE